MEKELILVEKDKPLLLADYEKIEKAMRRERRAFPYVMHDFFLLWTTRQIFDSNVSLVLENVFKNMKREPIKPIMNLKCNNNKPVLIKTVSRQTTFFYEDKEDGGYVVTCPALSGCITQGDTEEEATKNVKEAIHCYLSCARKYGIPIKM